MRLINKLIMFIKELFIGDDIKIESLPRLDNPEIREITLV